MQTRLLYRQDVYQQAFEARVLSCEPYKDRFAVELDQTCFYPEGGGQPADRGTLDGQAVLHVRESGGTVLHLLAAALPVGKTVRGQLDWPFRFCQMQHHTGEHIVSGIAHRLYGADNVGFHMGEELVTIDLSAELDAAQLKTVEQEANRVLQQDLPVQVTYPDPETLGRLDYRSKKELTGQVRIVTVPGADCCACCGTHVAATGQVGLVKLLAPQKYKGGVRLGLVCGMRALADYTAKDQSAADISHLLSAPVEGVAQAVRQLCDQQDALKARAAALQDQLFRLRCTAVGAGTGTVCLFEQDLAPSDLRRFAALLGESRKGISAVFVPAEGGLRYAVCCHSTDLRPLCKAWNAALSGRGGGDAALVQGSVAAPRQQVEQYFAGLRLPD